MKIFSWNCRGIHNLETIQTLRNWCWRERPDFVFIMESMIDRQRLDVVCNKCGFHNGICISSQGNSGGIGLWWRDQNVSLKSYSDRHIFVEIEMDDSGARWIANGIYGWVDRASKHKT